MLQRAALQWYSDNGVDEAMGDEPVNRFALAPPLPKQQIPQDSAMQDVVQDSMPSPQKRADIPVAAPIMGASAAQLEAIKLANAATTLEDLREAIAAFDGIEIKKTATNMVFSDGNPKAKIMLIGEGPGADEDRQGKPFVGVSGQLLDRILACIGLSRTAENPEDSLYISNVINWRPPGNRTPTPAEIAVSLPFIERHIALVKPDLIIMCGAVSAKALMNRSEGISRLRKADHSYSTLTAGLTEKVSDIPAIATYHPAYLLRTPQQKKAVWADMLKIQSMTQKTGQDQ